jgi:hypothetical protein
MHRTNNLRLNRSITMQNRGNIKPHPSIHPIPNMPQTSKLTNQTDLTNPLHRNEQKSHQNNCTTLDFNRSQLVANPTQTEGVRKTELTQ